jgi:hypothetical protein
MDDGLVACDLSPTVRKLYSRQVYAKVGRRLLFCVPNGSALLAIPELCVESGWKKQTFLIHRIYVLFPIVSCGIFRRAHSVYCSWLRPFRTLGDIAEWYARTPARVVDILPSHVS